MRTRLLREYALADQELATAMGLPEKEWGLFFCEDENGGHWTLLTDAENVHAIQLAAGDAGHLCISCVEKMVPDPAIYAERRGWPDEWGYLDAQ